MQAGIDFTARCMAAEALTNGGGTSDYTQLTNKPSINDVELSGNKTSANLGLQSAIDSTHKLDADLVDDTSSTNKFATAAELQQIEMNKTNISLLEQSNGAKNFINVNATSQTLSTLTFTVNTDKSITVNGAKPSSAVQLTINASVQLPAGDYVLIDGISGSASTLNITLYRGTSTWTGSTATGGKYEFTATGTDSYYCRIYVNQIADNVTFKPMIISKSMYDAGFTDYQPYCMTLAEITAWIQAQS